MDDYNITSLQESNNEWISRLISILTPCIINGCNSIYKEAYQLCVDNEEEDKYLMTFQNFLSRIPKWNPEIVSKEVESIKESTGCDYLEDLITCVHVIQLKALTCIRVGMEHRAIDIDVPKLNDFIHKVYITLARKLYTNVYLYEENIPPLDIQRNNRELEIMVRESILESVRESIPIENILKSYLDKTVEENVETVITTVEEPDTEPTKTTQAESQTQTNSDVTVTSPTHTVDSQSAPVTPSPSINEPPVNQMSKSLSFSNIDEAKNTDNTIENIHAPKDISTLEKISDQNYERRLLEEAEGDNDNEEDETLKISNENANIELDIETL